MFPKTIKTCFRTKRHFIQYPSNPHTYAFPFLHSFPYLHFNLWVPYPYKKGCLPERFPKEQLPLWQGKIEINLRSKIYKVKVKVTQSCPTDYTVHGILQARKLEWVAFPVSRGCSQPRDRTQVSFIAGGFFTSWATREAQEYWTVFPTQGSNPGLLHCRWILYQLSHKGSPRILDWVPYPFSGRSSLPRNWTGVSCIVGRFFTNWAMREAHSKI